MRITTHGYLLALALLASPAAAQTSAEVMTAREIARRGVQAYDAGDYETAASQLEQAYGVVKVPTIALYRARALAKLGKLVEASEVYREATMLSFDRGQRETQEQAQAEAKAEREKLLPRIPRLTAVVEGADRSDVTFLVDDAEVSGSLLEAGHALDPGEHVIAGRAGQREATKTVRLEEGTTETVTLRFAAQAPAAGTAGKPTHATTVSPITEDTGEGAERRRRWQRPTGFVAVGLGAAALVVGGVSGLSAKNKRDDLLAGGRTDDGVCFNDQPYSPRQLRLEHRLPADLFVSLLGRNRHEGHRRGRRVGRQPLLRSVGSVG